jgi:hypothetical protein
VCEREREVSFATERVSFTLEVTVPRNTVSRAHLPNITGGDEEMIHHLNVAIITVMRWQGMRDRAHIKAIGCKRDKGVRLESGWRARPCNAYRSSSKKIQTFQEECP